MWLEIRNRKRGGVRRAAETFQGLIRRKGAKAKAKVLCAGYSALEIQGWRPQKISQSF